MPTPQLCILLITSKLTLLVPIFVVLDALSYDFLDFSFALGRVSNRFFCHNAQVIRHSDAGLWRRSETQRDFLLPVALFLKTLLSAQLLFLLFGEIVRHHDCFVLLDLFVS